MSSHSKFVPDPSWPSIVELAIELWGQPNQRLSGHDDIRWGTNGAKHVTPSTNTFKDFEPPGGGGGYVDMWQLARRGAPLPPRETAGSKPKPGNGHGGKVPPWQNVGTVYHYQDPAGDLVLDVIRTINGSPRFLQRAPDGKWSVKHIPGHDCLLYRLPGLRASGDATVWIVEGEKDADRLHDELLIATCNIGGAGKWRDEYATEFRGKPVVILQDNDQAGRDHTAAIARSLSGVAASVKVLLLPGLPEKGDVSNWLDAGGTIDELERLAHDTPEYRKQTDPADHELPVIPWLDERLSDWAGRDVPLRGWVVPDWIPRGQCSGLYGPGGVNKTDLLIQLLLAKALGLPFLGHMLEPGPVYGLFLEDSREEIVRRAIRIAKTAWGYDSLAAFHNFHFVSLVGFDEPEFVSFDGTKMEIKQALYRVDQKIMEIGAHLVTLDTLPHFFGGNEIVRREVSRFIRKLDGISIARGCAFVVSAHPSARGRTSGSLESGSTGWEGGFRARLGLSDPGPEGGDDEPALKIASDRRVLSRIKSNYARQGETIELVIREGTFFVTTVGPEAAKRRKSGPERNAECDERFLQMLAAVADEGNHVNESVHSGRYAPKEFAQRPGHGDFKQAEFTRAMRRLFEAKRIRVIDFGPPSRSRRKIIDVQAEPETSPDAADEIEPQPPTPSPPPTEAEIDAEIARHITLDEKLREGDRPATAKRLGSMRLKTFDRLVTAALKLKAAPPDISENSSNAPITEHINA